MTYTSEQTRAIESLSPRICVDAGAGSGKTRVLVDRVVHLLEHGHASLDEIVAITFTEKAAGEMKQRLRDAFRARADVEDPAAMNRWREFERQVEYARISTIHSFCAALLRENALRLGLDPDFSVLAEADNLLMRQEVVEETLHARIETEDPGITLAVTMLSLQEVERLMHSLLGQRAVLHRLVQEWPIHDPEALRRAWCRALEAERQRRLLQLRLDPKAVQLLRRLRALEGKCLNAADVREIRRREMIAMLEELRTASDAKGVERTLQGLSAPGQGRAAGKNWADEECFKAVAKVQDDVKKWAEKHAAPAELDEAVEVESARICCAVCGVFNAVDAAYAEAKRRAATFDFDDLIEMTHEALLGQPAIRRRISAGMKFLLVDEFQDTDRTQAEILETLLPVAEQRGPHLFVVGDAKQSIYYFRGAEVEVFSGARREALELIPLDRNFRSLPEILNFVNDVFDRSGLLNRTGEYHPLQPHRKKMSDTRIEFLLEPEDIPEKLPAAEYRRLEAEQIASRIQELCSSGSVVKVCESGGGSTRPVRYGDIALLFQTLGEAYLYEEAFRKLDIPYQVVQGRGFFRRQELLDLLNAMKTVIDPWDESALLAFLRSPMARLSDEDLYFMTRQAGLSAAFHSGALPDADRDWSVLAAARDLITRLRDCLALPAPAFVRQLLELSGYEAVLLSQFNGVQKASNARKLIELAAEFARKTTSSIPAFVRFLDEMREQAIREGEALLQPETTGAVLLMTIHQSKGLEFPVVFVPDMGRDRGSSWSSAMPVHASLGLGVRYGGLETEQNKCAMARAIEERVAEEESAEHARLLYVVLTRARDYLLLSGKSTSDSLSWMGQLNALFDLSEKAHDSILEGRGWQARVTRQAGLRRPGVPATSKVSVPSWEALLQRAAPIPAGAGSVIAVSRLLDLLLAKAAADDEGEREEYASDSFGNDAALTRGSLVHRLFERWDFHEEEAPAIGEVLDGAGLGLLDQDAWQGELADVAQRFRKMALYSQLCGAKSVEKEAPFLLVLGGHVLRGIIDAVADERLLIDYKTGRFESETHARHVLQLRIYALAMRRLLGRTPERGVLAYVDAGREVEVLFEEADLEATEQLLLEALGRSQGARANAGS